MYMYIQGLTLLVPGFSHIKPCTHRKAEGEGSEKTCTCICGKTWQAFGSSMECSLWKQLTATHGVDISLCR